jgi:hypothetical protein
MGKTKGGLLGRKQQAGLFFCNHSCDDHRVVIL